MAVSYEITDIGKNYVTIHVTADSNYKYHRIMYRYRSSTALIDTISKTATRDYNYTISGLDSGTNYVINLAYSSENSDEVAWSYAGAQYFTTLAKAAIEPWDWYSSNGSATAAQTQAAHTAVTSKGATTDFSYLVWNDLVDKIWEACDCINKENDDPWWPYYLSYEDTKMTSSDKVLTAARFNSARYNVGAHESTGIAEVKSGDIIYGSDFIRLTDTLNILINKL